jgi:AcrR family transcriptional regulator
MKPTNSTRTLLLAHGLKIATEKGLRGVVVREVVASSGVNLGSFVYHFRNRERFLEELVELWYAPMYGRMKLTAEANDFRNALEGLRATLFQMVEIISQNAPFITNLLADAVAGERAAQVFLLAIPSRHPKLVIELVARAQAEGSIIQEPPVHLMMFVMASVGFPLLLAGGAWKLGDWLPEGTSAFKQFMSNPDRARQRLSWALKGICTEGEAP